MSAFKWSKRKVNAAMLLADGYTINETAENVEVNERTIRRWREDIDFSTEVDRLSLMVGIANRAERLRIAKRMIKKLANKQVPTRKDILEWLKYAQGETDGIKLDLASLAEAFSSMAAGGQEGSAEEKTSEGGEREV